MYENKGVECVGRVLSMYPNIPAMLEKSQITYILRKTPELKTK